MGFLGDMLIKGIGTLCGEETGEVFTGDGTGEKKDLFEKLLGKWNEIFKREDFTSNSPLITLKETEKLPLYFQILTGIYDSNSHITLAKQICEIKISQIKFEEETIDFACTNKFYWFNTSSNSSLLDTIRPYYYFRYQKGKNVLTFRYRPYLAGDVKVGYKKTGMDILTLGFSVGAQNTETSIRWQPEVTADSSEITPFLFFEKINHEEVYSNLKGFLKNLKISSYEEAAQEEERAKKLKREAEEQAEEEKYRKIAENAEQEKKKIYLEKKNTWRKKVDELISEFEAESALDEFLGSDSSENNLIEKKRAKLADEYFFKGKKAPNLIEQFDAFGIAAELGNIPAKREIGKSLYNGDFYSGGYYGFLKIKSEGLNILNQLAEQGDAESIEWLKKKILHSKQNIDRQDKGNEDIRLTDDTQEQTESEKQSDVLEQQRIAKDYITYQTKTLCFLFGWHTNISGEDISRIAYFGNLIYNDTDIDMEKLAEKEMNRIQRYQTEEDCFKWLFNLETKDIIALSRTIYATCFCALTKQYLEQLQEKQQIENDQRFVQACKNFCILRKIMSIDEFDEHKMSMTTSCRSAYSEFLLSISEINKEIAIDQDFMEIVKKLGEEK